MSSSEPKLPVEARAGINGSIVIEDKRSKELCRLHLSSVRSHIDYGKPGAEREAEEDLAWIARWLTRKINGELPRPKTRKG